MPLSDHEQRILDEIEKNLLQEDPGFAKKDRTPGDKRRQARAGALSFGAGFVGLLLFFSTSLVIVGVVAFATMVLGIVLVVRGLASHATSPAGLIESSRRRAGRFLSDWEDKVNQRRKKE